MHKLMDYICDEMSDLERKAEKDGKLSMAEVQYLDTLAHTKKNLLKADEMSEEGYSGMMYPRYYGDDRMDGGSYRDGRSYNDGRSYGDSRSYARGRRNARRDSMGRYSSRGYSMANDDMVEELHELMEKAPDEMTKREFKKFIDKIETM